MKTLYKLTIIPLTALVVGLGMILAGIIAKNANVTQIGALVLEIGMPVGIFIGVVIGLILMSLGKLDLSSRPPAPDEATAEQDELNDINSSYGYDSKIKYGEYVARHAARGSKNAKPRDKILGFAFLGFLLVDFALIPIFGILGLFVPMIVCFCLFGGTILTLLLYNVIREKISINGKPKPDTVYMDGTVELCMMSSSTSTGGSRRHSTTRVTGVTYRIEIESRGSKYVAFSRDFYETGTPVRFFLHGKKLATIVRTLNNN